MIPIKDIEEYNSRMKQAMQEKLWWLELVGKDITAVVDYGCADGALLREIQEREAAWKLFGYDFNEDMVALARSNLPAGQFSTDFYGLRNTVNRENTVLVASSVFHEIRNYSSDVDEEYRRIFDSGFRYIAIRDMFISENQHRPSNPESVAKVVQTLPERLVNDFERFMGPISRNENLLQLLLTYPYETNWDREVRENYFPHTVEQFLNRIPECYEMVYFKHETLPYIKEKVREDFGIQLQDKTHAKILLRYRNL